MDFREPSVPLKGKGHSSVCNGSFLLKERPVGFKGKTGICNHLNFNFLPNQNSVPVTHGIFSNKHDGICRTKRQSVYNKFQQFKIQIPWLQSRLPPIYHFLHQLSVPHPQGVSWKETGNITFVLPSPRQGKNPEVYNYFGQDSIFIIEKEIEVEMKAELYSFLLENKFKNGVMYIKSMHEFVVKYDMAESVEDESLMRGFQRWRKKMKK